MKRYTFIAYLVLLFLSSCAEIDTDNAEKTYSYWADGAPPKDVQVLHGKYWQSGHWTKEYEVYLHMNVSSQWWREFVEQNNLQPGVYTWIRDNKTPKWFNPSKNSIQFNSGSSSQYFWDSVTHECYLHEIQL